MNKTLNIYKHLGVTPLQVIASVRNIMPELKDEKIGYAGRLDPLARGVMLLMVGDATKSRDKYLSLKKEYEFEALFGVKTDTYDVLGMIQDSKTNQTLIVNKYVNQFVNSHIGNFTQPYPPYSSKPVSGKPLFWWARNNRLEEIEIPHKYITIEKFEIIDDKIIAKTELRKRITTAVNQVTGDFRQKEILNRWNLFFTDTQMDSFQIMRFRIICSSGTYVRGIVNELGQTLGTGAVALDILRTKVGEFELNDSIKLVASK